MIFDCSDDKSWCYSSVEGKKAHNKEFVEYGAKLEKTDVVGAYLDMGETDVTITFTRNGETQVTQPDSFLESLDFFKNVGLTIF